MKIKHVLATLTFSMAAGFAAFGLANHQGKVAEEASGYTKDNVPDKDYFFSFDKTQYWTDVQRVKAYVFGKDTPSYSTEYHIWCDLTEMTTAYDGSTIYKMNMPTPDEGVDYYGLIFVGMKSSEGAYTWDYQTLNLWINNFGDNNYFAINGKTEIEESKTKYDCNWSVLDDPLIDNGVYLRGDWGTEGQSDWGWSRTGQKEMSQDGDKYIVNDVPLSAEGEIKMIISNNGCITWTQPSEQSAGTTDFPAARTGEGGNVKVTKDGLYNVEVVLVSGTTYTYTLTGRADEYLTAAKNFASDFVSDVYAECPYNYSTGKVNTGKTYNDVKTLWSEKANDYSSLDEKAKAYLLTEKGSTVKEITSFWTVYDYTYGEIIAPGDTQGTLNFLNRSVSGSSNVTNTIDTMNNNALMIVVISSVSLIAVASFFMLKKKKESK